MEAIAVVDVGLGNVASVQNMLRRLGATVVSASSPDSLSDFSGIVLPGVGAYDTGVQRLRDSGLYEALANLPPEQPLLGICLGMQLLGLGSEEGSQSGLGRVDAHFVRLHDGEYPVPHMGWNEISLVGSDPVMRRLPPRSRFYFTHSYHAECGDSESVIAYAEYGHSVVAAYRNRGSVGVQFHPEKSHRFGMAFLRSWMEELC